jgi:N-methylhydantoinase B
VDEITLTATFGRHKYVPWGVDGGQPGSRNEVRIFHEDGREVVLGKCARYRLKRDEVARLVTATGGGWGDPLDRPVEDVVEDVKDGYVTPAQAERDYGVVLDPTTLDVVRLTQGREELR